MLAFSSLLLATAVSMAVVGWLPRPAAPQMRLDQAMQVLRGERPADSVGLRVDVRARAPEGTGHAHLLYVAAEGLQRHAQHVRLVWPGNSKPPDIHVIAAGAGQGSGGDTAALDAAQQVLASLPWPPFELAVQQADGRWRVVSSAYSDLAAWRRQVLLALLGGMVLLAPLAAWAAARLGRPLRRLADASAHLDLHAPTPLPDDGPREVQMLAVALDAGRTRLREQAQQMTRMLAAVAHDLRTPLTGLRLRAEFAPPAQAARMVADIERMNAMIEQVLDYARGELQPPQLQTIDLVPLLQDCAQAARLRGIEVAAELPVTLPWQADALLLRRALDNLIDNAGRYAGAVELRAAQLDALLQVDIMDRGPGIPAEDRERLLQPFQRSETSRSRTTGGTGLGLAVAANAARSHGGQLQLLQREGGGLIARLQLH
ncbi:two-component sensor histidine kinase [Stenotrophomonas sp. SPM]|uniref:sensor histidine kinase n=1 Tax=Stenotrophomonas sp. SPM TaxID=2170735 RepID=UPI000DE79591|nr:HAMP domain-containing sensor histidine kinase [Stenotrophomonas sp. SPM]PWB24887.1 two-component sensor histidine kinase [Stenotrophomonas sp. SPM]